MRSSSLPARTRLAQRLRRGAWLLGLAAVLALHPAAGAGEGCSRGLAALLRELLCGCSSCAGTEVARAESSCCGHAPAAPAPRGEDCDRDGGCTCSHPDELPLPQRGPLATVATTSASAEPAVLLAAAHGVAARSPCLVGADVAPHRLEERAPPDALDVGGADVPRERVAPSTRTRLARLATLLL